VRSSLSFSPNMILRASYESDPLASAAIWDRVLTRLLVCTSFFLGAILSCKDEQVERDRGEFGVQYDCMSRHGGKKTTNEKLVYEIS
jgi:hypothetical protein